MLDEQWVPINGYPNYEVSNYGRIINLVSGKDLTPHADKRSGTLRVTLYNEDGKKNVQVARVVLEGFFLHYQDDSEVCYENGDKSDCSVLNLSLGKVDFFERTAQHLSTLRDGTTVTFMDMSQDMIAKLIARSKEIRIARESK